MKREFDLARRGGTDNCVQGLNIGTTENQWITATTVWEFLHLWVTTDERHSYSVWNENDHLRIRLRIYAPGDPNEVYSHDHLANWDLQREPALWLAEILRCAYLLHENVNDKGRKL